ncbi:MAG: hypothetical protein Ta2B_01810 [Termitinemataceae bacterium]|nr:MAG: hypothetical protein Ta2B_01810 [Termitinemataceae bacterium]
MRQRKKIQTVPWPLTIFTSRILQMTYKNILAIRGSPRSEMLSVSKKMLAEFLQNGQLQNTCGKKEIAISPDAKITIVDSYKVNIKPCIHCRCCAKELMSCVYDNDVADDFTGLEKALNSADLLVIASPVYVLSFPSPLKAILDRLQKYFELTIKMRSSAVGEKKLLCKKQHIQNRKDGVLIACCGSNDTKCFNIMEAQLKLSFKAINTELIKTIYTANTDSIQGTSEY